LNILYYIEQTSDINAVIDINSMPLEQVKGKAESYVKGLFEFSNLSIKSK